MRKQRIDFGIMSSEHVEQCAARQTIIEYISGEYERVVLILLEVRGGLRWRHFGVDGQRAVTTNNAKRENVIKMPAFMQLKLDLSWTGVHIVFPAIRYFVVSVNLGFSWYSC